jgi:hypothetical protein
MFRTGQPGDSWPRTCNRPSVCHLHTIQSDGIGFYANRADFIRTAVRNQLERQEDAVRQSVARRQLKLGLSHYTLQDLEAARDAGTPLHIQVLGLASIASDVTPELARAAIASVQVLGAFQASPAVKAALADRTV